VKKQFIKIYFDQLKSTADLIDKKKIEKMVSCLSSLRFSKGRVFFAGVGGSAGNCSHAVNDFRKLCGIESYSLSENISELTARINDDGWENSYVDTLRSSNFSKKDVLFIFSVGGGNLKKKVSVNLIKCIKYAKSKKSKVISIVGKKDGYAYKNSNISLHIDVNNKKLITPITESYQAIVWHSLVSHPHLQINDTKW
jgi:D-sedoheptulose 7-phosphate isomerase